MDFLEICMVHWRASLLLLSNLLPKLQQYAFNSRGDALCVYGDPAYPFICKLPSKNPVRLIEKDFNSMMSPSDSRVVIWEHI